MGFSKNTQATRSTLMSVDSTLSENITAAQNYIPIASTTNFSTAIVAEIETTNEVVSFTDISENYAPYSQDFDNATWTKSNASIVADSTTAPDGTTTADTVVAAATTAAHQVYDVHTLSTLATFSVYAKANGYDFLGMYYATHGTRLASFNLATGTIGTVHGAYTANLSDEGDGWYRCSITTSTSIGTNNYAIIYTMESDDTNNFAGDGSSGCFLWGAQVEQAAVKSTYLPTTTTTPLYGLTDVTRGVNGTTAALATSGDAIQQLPYALSDLNMPTRLKAISVSSDGTGAGRFTLCDKIGTTLLDIDIPDDNLYELDFGDDRGIIFPNGIYVSNSDNITAYTLFTDKHSGAGL